MTDRASSSANITWSSYNYPTSIAASDKTGSEEVQFNYGPDRQRWEQIYTGPSGTETTYYVGKKLEVVFNGTTTYRHYIYAGAEPVAVYNYTSTGPTMSYMLEDHQGGVSAITSNAGVVNVDESFTAFGQLRNSEVWSGSPSSSELNALSTYTRQGYTFQTWLGQSMGLNHMNGRVEDAVLARMLSPDPHIPDPTNAQSYNRYSYVNNNPLTMVDPTGFKATTLPNCPQWSCIGTSYAPPNGIGSLGDGFGFTGVSANEEYWDAQDAAAAANSGVSFTVEPISGGGVPAPPDSSDPPSAGSGDPAQSQTQPGAQPDPSQQMLPEQTVTAQSQDPTLTQVSPAQSSQSPGMAPSADQLAPIVVTATRTPPTAPAFPGISGLMTDQLQASTAGPTPFSYTPYRLFSKPDAPSFMAAGALVGTAAGVATVPAAYAYAAAAGEMSLDAFAGLPVTISVSGGVAGLVVGAAAFGLYELQINSPPSPYPNGVAPGVPPVW